MCNRLIAGLIAAVALAAITGCPSRVKDDPPKVDVKPGPTTSGPSWFRDVAGQAGVQFTYKNGEEADQFTILETLGGGVAFIDYDGDGLLDIFVTGGGYFDGPDKKDIKGHPCKLYKNLGDWKFRDVTAEVGLDGVAWWYTHGAAVADYDCDGLPDLLVTGYGRMMLFHNESDGKDGRRFVDVTEKVGLREPPHPPLDKGGPQGGWSTSAGWADLDGDGYPDLYVCHYVDWSFANNPFCKGNSLGVKRDTCPPEKFKPLVHVLFRNERRAGSVSDRMFRNVSADHGFKATGCGLGVLLADLNDDGKPDIYVANDTNKNFLYVNRTPHPGPLPQGERGLKLEEKAQLAGVATDEAGKPEGSMGVDAGDYDGSGRASLWVTNFQGELHALYLNLGRESFHHQSRAAGTAALGHQWVGFGTGFVDVDNDGWEDLVIANGHVWRYPVSGTPKQRPILLHNVERGEPGGVNPRSRFFKDISPQGGDFFQSPALGRGVAIGDLDNDGWPDLVISHTNSPVALLRNEAATGMKPPNRWLGVKLMGRNHRDVVGSTITLEGSARKLTRFAKGGGSYLSANDPRILFGLGASEQIKRVTVKWAWGQTQTWENLEPNQYWELHEGEPNPTSLRKK